MHTQVDANLTRDHLARLLADENAALTEFETLLEREHTALSKRDIDALEALADARQSSITHLLRLEDERRQAVDALRQSEERFRVALKDSSIYGV